MMRSLFSGVSGLKNHQTRMDVTGNNISNVNTAGYKAGRVTFQDMLSQTITGAASAQGNRGGTNPKQVGLGMGMASIDTLFTDGSVQSTGKNTDLCISGNGFFILGDGANQYYTRSGAFEFDSAGNYVVPGSGLKVQGWMADANGVINSNGGVTNIVVPVGQTMAAVATTKGTYSKNLSANATSGTTTTAGLTQAQVKTTLGYATGSADETAVTGLSSGGIVTLSDGKTTVSYDGTTYTTKVSKTTDTTTPNLTLAQVKNNLSIATGSADETAINGLSTTSVTLSSGVKVDYSGTTGKYIITKTGFTSSAAVVTNLALTGADATTANSLLSTTNGSVSLTDGTVISCDGAGNYTIKQANLSQTQVNSNLSLTSGTIDYNSVASLNTTAATTTANLSGGVTVNYNGATGKYTIITPNLNNAAIMSKLALSSGTDYSNINALGKIALSSGDIVSYNGTTYTTQVTTTGLTKAQVQTNLGYAVGTQDDTDVNSLTTAGQSVTLSSGAIVSFDGTNYTTRVTTTGLTKAQVQTNLGYATGSSDDIDVSSLSSTKTITLSDLVTKVTWNGNGTYTLAQSSLTQAQVNSKLGLTSGTADYNSVDGLNTTTLADGTTKVSYNGTDYTIKTSKPAAATAVASFAAYDSEGVKHTITGTFTKSTTANEWTFSAGTTTDTGCKITGGTGTITFDSAGKYSGSTVTAISFNPSDTGLGGATATITLDFSAMTQFDGETTVAVDKDGNTAGSLQSVSTDSSGTIVGSFSNGLKRNLAQVALATFNNPGGLTKSGTSLYSSSNNSGQVQINTAGSGGAGSLTPSSLEMSNVDLSEEFSNMIVTQRGFQANSKIITVSDEMIETLVNLKR